jgi:hypothetical protein
MSSTPPTERSRSIMWAVTGFPGSGIKTLPGSRFDPMRAVMTAMTRAGI